MSVADEDTELRDLLVQTLEKNGVLGKIKAELRASIFLTLEAQDQVKNTSTLTNAKLQAFLSKPEGQTCVEIIHEFLEYFNLDYSSAVFTPETSSANLYKSRSHLCQKLNINDTEASSAPPILSTLLKERSHSRSTELSLSDVQRKRAKDLFSANCNVDTDSISSSSAVHVLSSLCPRFPLFLIERFVAQGANSLSQAISSRSFFAMYEQLFDACRSVVTDQGVTDVPMQEASLNFDKAEEKLVKQTIGLIEPIVEPSMSPQEETAVTTFDHFLDDDFYGKPKNSPTKFTDSRPSDSIKLPPVTDPSSIVSTNSEHSSKDWPQRDKRQHSYEDDFNSPSRASSDDVQGDSLSSNHSSLVELTEDNTISEKDIDADYMEDVI